MPITTITARAMTRFNQSWTLPVLVASSLLLPLNAWAMRCGSHLISKGDAQAKVLKYCGEPIQAKERLGLRRGTYLDRRSGISSGNDVLISRGSYIGYGRSEVLIEDWVFNFGPRKLMRRVSFANGFVENIETLGYGYRD